MLKFTNFSLIRFEEISASATPCSDKQKQKNECYGGFARISTLVKQARKSSTPTLFLNAGDTYFGSTWFIHYGWEIVAKFLNILKPDAIVSFFFFFTLPGSDYRKLAHAL